MDDEQKYKIDNIDELINKLNNINSNLLTYIYNIILNERCYL